MTILNEVKRGFDDVMLLPTAANHGEAPSSRKRVDVFRGFRFPYSRRTWEGFPIMNAAMDTICSVKMLSAFHNYRLFPIFDRSYSYQEMVHRADDFSAFRTMGMSIGLGPLDFYNIRDFIKFMEAELWEGFSHRGLLINLDVANGHTNQIRDYVAYLREKFPDETIMAGNVADPTATWNLFKAGADIVKVGIGSGSVCTTRLQTGVGYPQFDAIIECRKALNGTPGLVCSDGGCRTPGDVVKAFAAGADFVMLGGMFAGHEECKTQDFYGMASSKAHEKYLPGCHRTPEGKHVVLPKRGSVIHTIKDLMNCVQSACTYVGAKNLYQLHEHAVFAPVREQENRVFNGMLPE